MSSNLAGSWVGGAEHHPDPVGRARGRPRRPGDGETAVHHRLEGAPAAPPPRRGSAPADRSVVPGAPGVATDTRCTRPLGGLATSASTRPVGRARPSRPSRRRPRPPRRRSVDAHRRPRRASAARPWRARTHGSASTGPRPAAVDVDHGRVGGQARTLEHRRGRSCAAFPSTGPPRPRRARSAASGQASAASTAPPPATASDHPPAPGVCRPDGPPPLGEPRVDRRRAGCSDRSAGRRRRPAGVAGGRPAHPRTSLALLVEADQAHLGLERAPRCAPRPAARTPPMRRHTSSADPPSSAWMKLACFVDTSAVPSRRPFRPARVDEGSCRVAGRVGEHRSGVATRRAGWPVATARSRRSRRRPSVDRPAAATNSAHSTTSAGPTDERPVGGGEALDPVLVPSASRRGPSTGSDAGRPRRPSRGRRRSCARAPPTEPGTPTAHSRPGRRPRRPVGPAPAGPTRGAGPHHSRSRRHPRSASKPMKSEGSAGASRTASPAKPASATSRFEPFPTTSTGTGCRPPARPAPATRSASSRASTKSAAGPPTR